MIDVPVRRRNTRNIAAFFSHGLGERGEFCTKWMFGIVYDRDHTFTEGLVLGNVNVLVSQY